MLIAVVIANYAYDDLKGMIKNGYNDGGVIKIVIVIMIYYLST